MSKKVNRREMAFHVSTIIQFLVQAVSAGDYVSFGVDFGVLGSGRFWPQFEISNSISAFGSTELSHVQFRGMQRKLIASKFSEKQKL
ncbi:unnamed protein product, partial [Mesorhabditis belari]|uniref:Uncharacterized protein n=1 Tax=Mesorhabditis belari TaxID=2138241 RepID=A0AAF3FMX5_9BILA